MARKCYIHLSELKMIAPRSSTSLSGWSADEAEWYNVGMWYVYAIKGNSKIYIGMASDLKRRYSEHVAGKTHTTKRMGELRLIYYEAFLNKKDAARQELFYKSGYGREVLRKKLIDTLSDDCSEIV